MSIRDLGNGAYDCSELNGLFEETRIIRPQSKVRNQKPIPKPDMVKLNELIKSTGTHGAHGAHGAPAPVLNDTPAPVLNSEEIVVTLSPDSVKEITEQEQKELKRSLASELIVYVHHLWLDFIRCALNMGRQQEDGSLVIPAYLVTSWKKRLKGKGKELQIGDKALNTARTRGLFKVIQKYYKGFEKINKVLSEIPTSDINFNQLPDLRVHENDVETVDMPFDELVDDIRNNFRKIRNRYNVPAYTGVRVVNNGKYGTITGVSGDFLIVRTDSPSLTEFWDPSKVDYHIENNQVTQ